MVSTQTDWALNTSRALPNPGPVAASKRIEGIDVPRGLALFGVLAINIVFEFRVSIFAQFLPPHGAVPAIDRALQEVLAATIELKALALFSLLFGVGLAIQVDRLADNPHRLVLLIRRLLVLLVIGAVHLVLQVSRRIDHTRVERPWRGRQCAGDLRRDSGGGLKRDLGTEHAERCRRRVPMRVVHMRHR
jgi:hypothetical protein